MDQGDVSENVLRKTPSNSKHRVPKTHKQKSPTSVATSSTSDSCLVQNLNGVVLKYLENCGLEESYTMFYRECKMKGIDLPVQLSLPSFSKTKFSPSNGEQLLKHFDGQEGTELLHAWDHFLNDTDPSELNVCKMITFNLHVYVAIIPHLQNKSETEKLQGMRTLSDFFDKNPMKDLDDDNVLILFALPYVRDPMNQANLSYVFQCPWREKLRSDIQDVLKRHFQRQKNLNSAACDLTQMFLKWSQDAMVADSENNLAPSVSKTFHSQSSQTEESQNEEKDMLISTESQAADSTHLNKDFLDMQAQLKKQEYELMCLGKSKQKYEHQYHKLLKVTGQMASALDKALQGKAQDIGELLEQLQEVYPELFSSENSIEIEEIADYDGASEV